MEFSVLVQVRRQGATITAGLGISILIILQRYPDKEHYSDLGHYVIQRRAASSVVVHGV